MQREGPDSGIPAQGVELYDEQRVRRLRLAVRLPLVVAALELHIVPADAGEPVTVGGHRDDPCPAARERRPEPVDERVVAEVVGGELCLQSGADPGLGSGHDARVVDEQVDIAVRGEETLGEGAHTAEVGQVELVHLHTVDAVDRLLGGRAPPCGYDAPGAGAASARVVSRPRPEWPPVTIASFPERSMPRRTSSVVDRAPNPDPSLCCSVFMRRRLRIGVRSRASRRGPERCAVREPCGRLPWVGGPGSFSHTTTGSPSSPRITKFGLRTGSAAGLSPGARSSRASMDAVSSIRASGAPMQ